MKIPKMDELSAGSVRLIKLDIKLSRELRGVIRKDTVSHRKK